MPPFADNASPPTAWLEFADKRAHPLTRDCYIGRVEGNEIIIPDHRISRRHAVVQCHGPRCTLVDLGSTNGTFLNDTRIFKPAPLHDGDVIGIGGERYVFCQPAGGEDAGENVASTAVAVGKCACWMLLASVSDSGRPSAGEWLEQTRASLLRANASVKRVRPTVLLAHWRVGVAPLAAVRTVVEELAHTPRPPGARVVLHYGMVRVGAGTGPAEENLLGADVTFTHKLETTALDLGVGFLLSAPAVRSLDLEPTAKPLDAQSVRDTSGAHRLFAL